MDIENIADYDKNVVAYVGARNWNKFKFKKDYTNASQLKFSNIKTPGAGYLVDMKRWLGYTVQITFNKFPIQILQIYQRSAGKLFMEDNIMCLRAYPTHQSTDNIHLRLNNRDIICYPTQMLNQRLEYWNQDRLKESCGFCPHRKPSCQTTYHLESTANAGRSQFMNLGSAYDGDFGNEVVFGNVTYDLKVEDETPVCGGS